MGQTQQVRWKKIITVVFCAIVCMLLAGGKAEAKKKRYAVTTKTVPCIEEYQKGKNQNYNTNTKHYYMLRSYLEKMAKKGGTLTLKKGTYKIPCTLYVPSNVTIKLKKGVKLVKTSKTGTKKLKATSYMFQMVSYKKAKTKRKIKDYGASKNVTLIGLGTVTIDLKKVKNATAIYMGHARNIAIKNIRFKNRNGGNYLRIEGSKKITVYKCKFYKAAGNPAVSGKRPAVRLETINSETNSFSGKWSKLDNTINEGIQIKKNSFYSQDVGVGSSKYATRVKNGKRRIYYQKGITISGNVFTNPGRAAIYAVGWRWPVISSNTMKRTSRSTKSDFYLLGYGVYNPTVTKNIFKKCHYPMCFGTAVNRGRSRKFAKLASTLTTSCMNRWDSNRFIDVTHYFVKNDSTRIFYFRNRTDRNFTLSIKSAPYRERYTDRSDFSAKRVYYVFQSYMDQLEYAGGGTITVTAGTYPVTNNICIPSNVTLNLQNGVTFYKAGTTSKDVAYAKAIFTLVPPSKDGTKKTVSGYNGSHNVTIKGSGNVIINCVNVKNAMAIVMGHARNVTIRGITCLNQYGTHFIELNSSNNVTVENCTFKGFTPSNQKSHKECINIDGTDENTGGFRYNWSAHDKTTCKTVTIRNNTFQNVGTAIGSHTYSAAGKTQLYHENVKIYGNEVNGTYNAAIRALNWKDCVIKNNTLKNIQSLKDGKLNDKGEQTKYAALLLRGVVNPTVTQNVIDTCKYYPIYVTQVETPRTDESAKAGYPNTECIISAQNWAAMKKNTIINVPEEFRFILVRSNEDENDSSGAKEEFLS
ncbi:MAG: hypothetical protein J1E62_11320 [Lachnospiraceae bacterium]|nr:hypothetical protein [Lachnospiraceae bacterium]